MLLKLIAYVSVVLILSMVVFPSPVLAEDEDLLTPAEESFTLQMASKIYRARSVLDTYYKLTGNLRKFIELRGEEYRGILIEATSFDSCLSPASVPDTMADIADLWNTEVCNDFGYISSEVASFAEPELNIFDFYAGVSLIKLRVGSIRASVSKIEGMLADRVDELKEKRKAAKEAEQEAKKELGLGDDECFIATAAYGTPTAVEIYELRRFRDDYLRKSTLGNEFIEFYYENSPPIADFISKYEILRTVIRKGFVDPVVTIVDLTEHYWSE